MIDVEVIVGQPWSEFIRRIEDLTLFTVDSVDKQTPAQFICLYDDDGNEYEAEINKYSNGQYELRSYNITKVREG